MLIATRSNRRRRSKPRPTPVVRFDFIRQFFTSRSIVHPTPGRGKPGIYDRSDFSAADLSLLSLRLVPEFFVLVQTVRARAGRVRCDPSFWSPNDSASNVYLFVLIARALPGPAPATVAESVAHPRVLGQNSDRTLSCVRAESHRSFRAFLGCARSRSPAGLLVCKSYRDRR